MKTGVFAGLITLDCIYQTRKGLAANEKQVAEAMLLAAGGPATNAAIAFQALGGRAILIGALGQHPLTTVIQEDLAQYGVELVDMTPEATAPPPFSSIVVNVETGDRAVISRNVIDRPHIKQQPAAHLVAAMDCLLVDGHQMWLSQQLAQQARQHNIPVIVDAGSWKSGFETVFALATQVIASANFAPPDRKTEWDAIAYLQSLDVPYSAVTRGDQSILYSTPSASSELPVPSIQPVDTLGAGDVFHGAFCYGYADRLDFLNALNFGAEIAAIACQSFGTRQWIQKLPQ
ncbi:PfkB family carbohydrate kinase [Oscillatoria sp. CS-180]|uniref:PfkB family carbohydrate kinase n=1 Tax=Oscillatoria sp. CS-180 TaxID=3021720 RepID=UPI0023303C27|nr:PfkB family carbohydrate kinase [Oscillatoria sp. CS-180]MDB9525476.1 PfkB family carbohydrate kinase [Oscillatoria sp. CS-180]